MMNDILQPLLFDELKIKKLTILILIENLIDR